MLYAPLDRNGLDYLPMYWDTSQAMMKHLYHMSFGYQLRMERRMFALREHPEYRAVLLAWNNGKPTRLLVTGDPRQLEAALFMLIKEAELQDKAQTF